MKAAALIALPALALAQDPAQGWLGYAMATSPSGGIITHIEAKWVNGQNPKNSNSFYSPWFGIESSDNLNLLQPVNPWLGNGWLIYNEYYQWVPTNNIDSAQHTSKPGDILYGAVDYDPNTHSYNIIHTDMTDGWTVTTNIPIQKKNNVYKNMTIAYFVYEKVAPCNDYPPEGIVTFYDIKIEYDNAPVSPVFTTGIVDDVCNMRAHILNETSVSITWNTAAPNPDAGLIARSQSTGFGGHGPRPVATA